MSCFGGILKEIPNISIDRFDGPNLQSTCFFLSHCHTDHMVGLDSPRLLDHVHRNDYKIYCHRTSKSLLAGMNEEHFKLLLPYVQEIEVNTEYQITIPKSETNDNVQTIVFYPLHAGHCPGSVMFYFKTATLKILYTGDYRIPDPERPSRLPLIDCNGDPIVDLDALYIDTTFYADETRFLPSRAVCVNAVEKIARDWLYSNKTNVVVVKTPYNYGYEFLLTNLSERLNTKILVHENTFNLYQFVTQISKIMTTKPDNIRIHSCKRAHSKQLSDCSFYSDLPESRILTIIPTAMFFKSPYITPSRLLKCESERVIRFCYSTHASMEEIVLFVKSAKAKKIVPCVNPDSSEPLEAVSESLSKFTVTDEASYTTHDESSFRNTQITFDRFRRKRKYPLLEYGDRDEDATISPS